jgi:hypothetical protein
MNAPASAGIAAARIARSIACDMVLVLPLMRFAK